jgi:hypothetical protein
MRLQMYVHGVGAVTGCKCLSVLTGPSSVFCAHYQQMYKGLVAPFRAGFRRIVLVPWNKVRGRI